MQDITTKEGYDIIKALPRKTVIYAVVRNVSKSGLTKSVSFKYVADGQLLNLTYYIGQIFNYKVADFHGYNVLKVGNLDSVIYNLGRAIHNDPDYFRLEIA